MPSPKEHLQVLVPNRDVRIRMEMVDAHRFEFSYWGFRTLQDGELGYDAFIVMHGA